MTALGDLDGDGVGDLAVGSILDDDGIPDLAVGSPGVHQGGFGTGAVWVLFLNADGTVRAQQAISATSGGFMGTLGDYDGFGAAVAPLGDFDGDGVEDLAEDPACFAAGLQVPRPRLRPLSGQVAAIAVETPGFQPQRVVRVEAEFGRSGALDNLRWDPRP